MFTTAQRILTVGLRMWHLKPTWLLTLTLRVIILAQSYLVYHVGLFN